MSLKIENTKSELVGIYDENNNYIGNATRKEMRQKNLIHRATSIFVINQENKLLVQRRSELKEYCPSFLDLCVGGVITDKEDDIELSAEREIEEEIGIVVKDTKSKKINFFSCHLFEEDICKSWEYCYYLKINEEEMHKIYFKDKEVSEIFWYTKDEINKIIEEKNDNITKDSIMAYKKLLSLGLF